MSPSDVDSVDSVADPEEMAEAILRGDDDYVIPEGLVEEPTPAITAKNLHHEIMALSIGQRLKLALKGNRDARSILIHDANPMIQRFVLRNPRLTEEEALQFAKNRNLDSEVMVIIGKRKEWARNNNIRLALVTNPKTPLALALRFVSTLSEREVRALAKNRNVPAAVTGAARRMIDTGKFKR